MAPAASGAKTEDIFYEEESLEKTSSPLYIEIMRIVLR